MRNQDTRSSDQTTSRDLFLKGNHSPAALVPVPSPTHGPYWETGTFAPGDFCHGFSHSHFALKKAASEYCKERVEDSKPALMRFREWGIWGSTFWGSVQNSLTFAAAKLFG